MEWDGGASYCVLFKDSLHATHERLMYNQSYLNY